MGHGFQFANCFCGESSTGIYWRYVTNNPNIANLKKFRSFTMKKPLGTCPLVHHVQDVPVRLFITFDVYHLPRSQCLGIHTLWQTYNNLWKITILNGKTHCFYSPFSIKKLLVYQRVIQNLPTFQYPAAHMAYKTPAKGVSSLGQKSIPINVRCFNERCWR